VGAGFDAPKGRAMTPANRHAGFAHGPAKLALPGAGPIGEINLPNQLLGGRATADRHPSAAREGGIALSEVLGAEMAPYPARVRIGAIREAWHLMKPNLNVWIGATLILLFCSLAVWLVVISGFVAVLGGQEAIRRYAALPRETAPLALYVFGFLVWVAVTSFSALFVGGMVRMAVRQARGEALGVGELFGATDAFGRLFALCLGVSLVDSALGYVGGLFAELVGGLLASVLGPQSGHILRTIIGGIIGLILWGPLLFAAPLMLDQGLGVTQAVRGSIEALRGQMPMAIAFALVAQLLPTVPVACFIGLLVLTVSAMGLEGLLIAAVGGIVCFIWLLRTIPLAVSALGVLYRDFFPQPTGASLGAQAVPLPPRA
jgi:hypothetical protein